MGDSKLGYKLEKMVQNLLNKFVIKDKTFRVSTPVDIETIKRIFGHALSQKQLGDLQGHDGIVALFSDETEVVEHPPKGYSAGYKTVDIKKNSVERRRNMKDDAKSTISLLEPYLGKPAVDVWEAIDQWKNIFGERSIYVCCFFVLDESGFTNIVVEKNPDEKENN